MLMCENPDCGWYGEDNQLNCSDEDDKSNKPTNKIVYNLCPDCGGTEFEEIDEEEDDE